MGASKKIYVIELFKSLQNIILTLLFTSVAMTGILASYEFGLFGLLYKNTHLFKYAVIAFSIISGFTLIAMLFEIKSKKLTFFDSIFLAMILVSIAYVIYIDNYGGLIFKQRTIFVAVLLSVGIISIILRSIFFNPGNIPSVTKCRRNTLKNYYKTIINKYSLFVILAIAAVCICAGYLMFNMMFARSIYKQKIDVYAGLALLVPFVVYAIKSSFNEKINLIDAIILSGLISIPVLTVQVFKLAYSPLRVGIIGSVTMAWLILTFVRYTTFDMRATLDKTAKPACDCNCKIGFYYKSLFKKYGFFSALAIASLIALATLAMLGTYVVKTYFINTDFIHAPLKIIPISVVLGACLIGLGFSAIGALTAIFSKKVGAGDYLLLLCLLFCILGFVVYAAHLSPNFLKLLLPFTVYSVILTAIRIAVVKKD